MIGTTLAHYRITAALGAGGMGEVWRAEDEKLGREVALKVLPADVAEDPDRLARVEREAKVLASLNHPNIATLFGLETESVCHPERAERVEGSPDVGAASPAQRVPQSSGGPSTRSSDSLAQDDIRSFTFLVMELVEGEDLSDRIARGALPIDEAIPIALQISEALEAAHESGIVHRDLKPANVKLRPDGTVKVLDFGLAKAWESDAGDSSLSLSPTLTQHATAAGVILGTAAYMSPEQARGKKVDRRADIWAFGVVLWEMLTGHKLFDGETVTDVLAAVLTREPDLDELPAGTSNTVRRLVGRCLNRDPKQRLQWIGDARLELGSVDDDGGLPTVDVASESVSPRSRRLPWAVAGIAVLAALVIAAWALLRPAASAPVIAGTVSAPDEHHLQFFYSYSGSLSVSPNGRWITFSAAMGDEPARLWLRSIGSVEARPIEGTDNASFPFWSPDSRQIAFFDGEKLKRVGLDGSPAVTLCDAPNGRSGGWNSDGVILFSPTPQDPIYRIPAGGGDPVEVTTFDVERGETTHRWASFLPDGKHFLYLAATHREGIESEVHGIWVGDLDGTPSRLLVHARTNPVYASGYLLYVREEVLLAHPFDPDRLELTGDPIPVVSGVGVDLPYYRADFAASDAGVLLYRKGSTSDKFQLYEADVEGNLGSPVGDPARIFTIAIDRTGQRAALVVSDPESGTDDIWVHDIDRDLRSRLSFGELDEWSPVWSPDGRHVAYGAGDETGSTEIWIVEVDGSGEPELLRKEEERIVLTAWSPDGRWLLANSFPDSSQDSVDIIVLPLDGGEAVDVMVSQFGERANDLSPDGRWMLYTSAASGSSELFVTSFPKPGRRWQVAGGNVVGGQWQGTDKIFFITDEASTFSTPVVMTGTSINLGRPIPHQKMTSAVMAGDIFPEGDRVLLAVLPDEEKALPVIFMTNWTESLGDR